MNNQERLKQYLDPYDRIIKKI